MKIKFLLLISFTVITLNAQQEEYTSYLEQALQAIENNDEKEFNINLKYFSTALEKDKITPEILTEKNLELYTQCLYTAVLKEYRISDDLGKNAVKFLKHNIENYPENMNSLGYLYQYGYGIPQDFILARYWYEKGLENGQVVSLNYLGILYFKGHGVPRDFSQAKSWFEKAAIEKEDPSGMYNLATVYLNGGYGVEKDYSKAVYWFKKAAENDQEKAMNNLGTIYYKGQGVEIDYVAAKDWYQKAIEKGNVAAMNNLATLYLYGGYGLPQDEELARYWYQKASDAENTAAMIGLGVLHENNKEAGQAKKWYKKACELGNDTGCEYFDSIN